MPENDAKKGSGWRKRTVGTVNQIGQAFHLEPHGDKSKLPKALQQVSFNEIPEMLERNKRKKMTEEELAEEELIDQAIAEQVEEEIEMQRQKNLLQKLTDVMDKQQKRKRLKNALQEAKEEQNANESESGDGYGERNETLEKAQKRIDDENSVFG
jgi:hypothetical protein